MTCCICGIREGKGEPMKICDVCRERYEKKGHECELCGDEIQEEGYCEYCKDALLEKQKQETVNHPSHYTHGEYEVIDVIEDWDLNFRLANAIKYIARCDHKGKKVEDLQKAIFYIQREIDKSKEDKKIKVNSREIDSL